jgi:hypothetical protein
MATTGVQFSVLRDRLQAISDLTATEANARLNQRHKEMVAGARALRERLSAGTTTASVSDYAVPPEVVEVMTVFVDGKPYDKVDHDTMDDLIAGYSWISYSSYSSNAVFTDTYTGSGTAEVSLYPTPTVSGLAITLRAAVLPPDLVGDNDFPSLPPDFHEDLVDAALATTFLRDEERLGEAQALEARFQGRIAELRRRLGDRIGSGPVQIRIVR